ncbi:MAG TPA: hypothetical protein VME92_05925 [Acetobacteraceae bacterium]|nr:hypothetical protein [Acetobacteraceae bacterium]
MRIDSFFALDSLALNVASWSREEIEAAIDALIELPDAADASSGNPAPDANAVPATGCWAIRRKPNEAPAPAYPSSRFTSRLARSFSLRRKNARASAKDTRAGASWRCSPTPAIGRTGVGG